MFYSLGVFWWFFLHFVLLCSLYLERVQRRPNKHRLISNFGPDTPPQYFVSFSVSILKIRDRPAKNPISVPLPQKKIMNNEISILKKKQIVTNQQLWSSDRPAEYCFSIFCLAFSKKKLQMIINEIVDSYQTHFKRCQS